MNKRIPMANDPVKVKRRDDGRGINSGVPPFAARTPQGHPLPKPHKGWPNHRKKKDTPAERKLQGRRRDYDQMLDRTGPYSGAAKWNGPVGSYHKPGSNK